MNPETVGVALAAILLGTYAVLNPHGRFLESFPSAKAWAESPDRAEREQARWARGMGVLLVTLGIALFAFGFVVL